MAALNRVINTLWQPSRAFVVMFVVMFVVITSIGVVVTYCNLRDIL